MSSLYSLKQRLEKTDNLMKDLFKQTNLFQLKRRHGTVLLLNGGKKTLCNESGFEKGEKIVKVFRIDDAKEFIANNPVRVLILDICQKDYGFELLEWVKDHYPELPIVANVSECDIQESIERVFPDVELIMHDGKEDKCNDVMDCIHNNQTSTPKLAF